MTAPLPRYHDTIIPAWIDANNHLNLAYYVLLFDRATDLVFERLGIGSAYMRENACSVFIAETHTRYEREVTVNAQIEIATAIFAVDSKRIHFGHTLFIKGENQSCATHELLGLNIDMQTRRVAPFLSATEHRIGALITPAPAWAGQKIAMKAPK